MNDISKDDVIQSQFICAWYGRHGIHSLDTLRAHLFGTMKSGLWCLPPAQDAMNLHIQQCMYQFAICKQACLPQMVLPDIATYCREIKDGKPVTQKITKSPRPDIWQKQMLCSYLSQKCLCNCKCANQYVKCSIGCMCTGAIEKCGSNVIFIEDEWLIPEMRQMHMRLNILVNWHGDLESSLPLK